MRKEMNEQTKGEEQGSSQFLLSTQTATSTVKMNQKMKNMAWMTKQRKHNKHQKKRGKQHYSRPSNKTWQLFRMIKSSLQWIQPTLAQGDSSSPSLKTRSIMVETQHRGFGR